MCSIAYLTPKMLQNDSIERKPSRLAGKSCRNQPCYEKLRHMKVLKTALANGPSDLIYEPRSQPGNFVGKDDGGGRLW